MTIIDEITNKLFSLQDTNYREFQTKLIPTVDRKSIIGVRTPDLRSLAKEMAKKENIDEFLQALPHKYFDEDQLHAFIISGINDYECCVRKVNSFLPSINNWATCVQMSPKVFRRHKHELLSEIIRWIDSGETYTVRFGVGMLMEHFLDEDFEERFLKMAADVRSDEYYVSMMVAWFFATALAKQYDAAIPFIEEQRLDPQTHNRAIQKAVESYRIPPERKAHLRGLKVRAK